jgi:hypothetical protein
MYQYLTHRLLAHTYYVKVIGWSYSLNLFTTKRCPQRDFIDHTVSQSYTKIISISYHVTSITILKSFHPHTLYSREDPRLLVTVSTTVITVIHYVKVYVMYPQVVISSLCGWLENIIFIIIYTSFGVWPRDHYMSLQRFTMSCMSGLAKVIHNIIAMLRFLGVVRGTTAPLAPCEPERIIMSLPTHPSKVHFS